MRAIEREEGGDGGREGGRERKRERESNTTTSVHVLS